MSDETTEPSAESGTSINWKLVREALARRELTGPDIVEVEEVSGTADGNVVVSGKNLAGITVHRMVEPDAAFERIAAAAIQTSQQIQDLYDQAKQQAVFWFRASAVAAVLGFVLAFGGIIAILFFQQSTVVVLSTVCGVLFEIVATLFFKQSTEANKRVDGYRKDLLNAQATYQAIELCETIEDPEAKRRQIEAIIRKMLDVERDS